MSRDLLLWLVLGLLLALLLPHFYHRLHQATRSPVQANRPGLYDVARIPYLDLVAGDHSTDQKVLKQMKKYGFFYVTQIPDYDSYKELELLKKFFNLPTDVKYKVAVTKHNPANSNVYRGYGPAMDNINTQYKEVFNIGPHEVETETKSYSTAKKISVERNVWPVTDDNSFDEEFKHTFQKGFSIRKTVAQSVIKCIGRALHAPQLIERFKHHEFSTLGLRKYPKRGSTGGSSKTVSSFDGEMLTELEHVDSTVTVLTTFSNPGLQALYKGVYEDVDPTGDSFIINIGALLEDITESQIMAVRHRVKDIQRERFSIPFFFNPSFDADISSSIHGKKTPAGEHSETFGEWMTQYLPAVEPILLRGNALLG
uniref:Putative isopenicillin-n-synthase n=1 Tax=Euplokamis dunlapae TaxID=1403701 RepID=A0A0A0RX40_9METZ|nr:putative isopenicillin-n-synthase [Euplokamis dunlapae]